MPHSHRLTAEERRYLKERVSAARSREGRCQRGLAEHAYEAANGDSYYALHLAVEFMRDHLPEAEGKKARRLSPQRAAVEELIK